MPTLGLDKLAPPGKQSAVDPTPACLLCSLPLSLERLLQLQLLVAAWSQRFPQLDLSLQQAPFDHRHRHRHRLPREILCVTPSQKYYNDRLFGYSLVCKCFTSPYPRVAVHTRVIPYHPKGPRTQKGSNRRSKIAHRRYVRHPGPKTTRPTQAAPPLLTPGAILHPPSRSCPRATRWLASWPVQRARPYNYISIPGRTRHQVLDTTGTKGKGLEKSFCPSSYASRATFLTSLHLSHFSPLTRLPFSSSRLLRFFPCACFGEFAEIFCWRIKVSCSLFLIAYCCVRPPP